MNQKFIKNLTRTKNNFTIFQKYQTNPDVDLFGIREHLKPIIKACGEQYSIY